MSELTLILMCLFGYIHFTYSISLQKIQTRRGAECAGIKTTPNKARGTDPFIATWPKQSSGFVRVPYIFDNTLSSDAIKAVELGRVLYKRHTCISLEPRLSTDVDYVKFQGSEFGCWSNLGRQGGMQEINLEDPGCAYDLGTTLHEIAHALGVHHEQSRPDRDNYVDIYFDNIESGEEHNFDIDYSINSFGSEYDYLSMMHYSSTAFAIGNTTTLLKKNGEAIRGQENGFSQLDIEQLNILYDCGEVNEGVVETTSCYNPEDNGLSYRGTLAVTDGLYDCASWVDYLFPEDYYLNNMEKNYCRNPNPVYYDQPICFVLIDGETYYDTCNVPQCESQKTTETSNPVTINATTQHLVSEVTTQPLTAESSTTTPSTIEQLTTTKSPSSIPTTTQSSKTQSSITEITTEPIITTNPIIDVSSSKQITFKTISDDCRRFNNPCNILIICSLFYSFIMHKTLLL